MISLVQPSRGHITQFYGARQVDGNPHAGQDYAYSRGGETFPEVYAAADGVVLFAGDSRGLSWPNIMYLNIDFDRTDNVDTSAGNYTIIAHHDSAGNRIALTGYGHQEEVWVKAGQTVRKGQRIGTVGATGFSAGKHLHFDLVLFPFDVDDAPYYGRVDPNPYFTAGTTYILANGQIGTTTSEEDELAFTISDLLNHSAYDGGPTVSQVLKNLDDSSVTRFVKSDSDDEPTLYDMADGKLRPISYNEWLATGRPYRKLPKSIIDALPKV